MNLSATQDPAEASVTLHWETPTNNGDQVTSYDVRFKPVDAAHYTYLAPIGTVCVESTACMCVRAHAQHNIFR